MLFSVITSGIGYRLSQLEKLKRDLEAQMTGTLEWLLIDDHVRSGLSSSQLRIKTILIGRHRSIARQLLSKATGRYFIFLNVHDVLAPRALQRLKLTLDFHHGSQIWVYDLHLNMNREQSDQNQYFNYSGEVPVLNTPYHQWLDNRFWLYRYEHEYDDLASRLQLEGKVLPLELMEIDLPFFNVNLEPDANLNFMLQNLERADGVVQLSQFNGTGLRKPFLNLDQWFKWIKACFNSLLDLSDQTLIDVFLHYFIINLDRHFYRTLILNTTWSSSQRVGILIEIQKILQLINPNSFDVFKNHERRLSTLSQKILLAIKQGRFPEAERFMVLLIKIRKYHRLISNRLADRFGYLN